jgi:toxin ParE1/3/4
MERRLVWLQAALDELARIHDWLGTLPYGRPSETVRIIVDSVGTLAKRDIGKPGRFPGTREMRVPSRPYVVVYRLDAEEVTILTVKHTRQNWP